MNSRGGKLQDWRWSYFIRTDMTACRRSKGCARLSGAVQKHNYKMIRMENASARRVFLAHAMQQEAGTRGRVEQQSVIESDIFMSSRPSFQARRTPSRRRFYSGPAGLRGRGRKNAVPSPPAKTREAAPLLTL